MDMDKSVARGEAEADHTSVVFPWNSMAGRRGGRHRGTKKRQTRLFFLHIALRQNVNRDLLETADQLNVVLFIFLLFRIEKNKNIVQVWHD
jgi:hypothetical protein